MKSSVIGVCFVFILFGSCKNQNQNEDNNAEGSDIENRNINIIENHSLMDVEDYVQWVQDPENGFRKEKKIDDMTFSVQYKPYEYIACMEEKKTEMEDSIVKQKVLELSDMDYFDLKISLNEGNGELLKYKLSSSQQYTDRVNYFAFQMQKDIQLVDGNDTIPCALYHFERTYDVAPSGTFLLGFSAAKKKIKGDRTLVVYDRTFNKGLLKFRFKKQELKNLPKLKTV